MSENEAKHACMDGMIIMENLVRTKVKKQHINPLLPDVALAQPLENIIHFLDYKICSLVFLSAKILLPMTNCR